MLVLWKAFDWDANEFHGSISVGSDTTIEAIEEKVFSLIPRGVVRFHLDIADPKRAWIAEYHRRDSTWVRVFESRMFPTWWTFFIFCLIALPPLLFWWLIFRG